MEGKNRFIRSLRVKNILSFGPEAAEIDLQPLNVLIGPNASGKSNLIEIIGLLRAAPGELRKPIREGGGVDDWLWKGPNADSTGKIEVVFNYPVGKQPLRYTLEFSRSGQQLKIVNESLKNEGPADGETGVYSPYHLSERSPAVKVREGNAEAVYIKPTVADNDLEQSILSQPKNLDQNPELAYLGSQLAKIRLYRGWNVGPNSAVRSPQRTDSPQDFLLEDGSNLALVLHDLINRGLGDTLLFWLNELYYEAGKIITREDGGKIQFFVCEKEREQPVPATRLSDGTIRFLCLLSILCHPEPPPLICIEEPESGIHPDVVPEVAKLLIEASQRTQLIVTTYSDMLISALPPESIVVCERMITGSDFRRLNPQKLEKWLEEYTLGDLWHKGMLGGTRW